MMKENPINPMEDSETGNGAPMIQDRLPDSDGGKGSETKKYQHAAPD